MIKAIITDFDGTLVDTFEANLATYQKVLGNFGVELSREKYRECFGLRFDAFMTTIGIDDTLMRNHIKEAKTALYPTFFEKLLPKRLWIGKSVHVACAQSWKKP